MKGSWLACVLGLAVGCGDQTKPESEVPTVFTMVTQGGFTAPVDTVASPDGETFVFLATDDAGAPAVFSVSSAPGSTATELVSGAPLVEPSGLVMACDGSAVFVTDRGANTVFSLAGTTLTDLGVTGIGAPAGVGMGPDCTTLLVTGHSGPLPAVFHVPITGGAAMVVLAGSQLGEPQGVHVDAQAVQWVDGLTGAGSGELFAISEDGSSIDPVATVRVGSSIRVSLVHGGGAAVMPSLAADDSPQLTVIELATGAVSTEPLPGLVGPSGLRTARDVAVFAIADEAADAIYRGD